MSVCLGIDTSNYTTSAAVFDVCSGRIIQEKMLLPVKKGELGLRQSDAVFHHTRQLPLIIEKLFGNDLSRPDCIGVSIKPRGIEGSYMPCFLCGQGLAHSISSIYKVPVYETSHQVGHILAALYSAGRLDLIKEKFIAFHVSGGTTDCLLVECDEDKILKITDIGSSLDLKAGQAIDRVGLMLGLDFPCGRELEKLAAQSSRNFKIKPVLKEMNCCLSGIENQCADMLKNGADKSDTALFCLCGIYEAINGMAERAKEKFGKLPVLFAGGVMSDKIIAEKLKNNFEAYFAEPEFSCDNAAGTAIFSALKEKLI